ncbi:MAG: hypothetical protein WC070_00755 [Candidatus Magasanikbacteria bacterium]
MSLFSVDETDEEKKEKEEEKAKKDKKSLFDIGVKAGKEEALEDAEAKKNKSSW